MRRAISLVATLMFLSGCASHPTVPEGYTGPVARLDDSATRLDVGKADIFFLSHVDGRRIESSLLATRRASYGQGNYLRPVLLENRVPAELHTFTIVGMTEYAMPIRAILGKVHYVKGDVVFSPKDNGNYVVKGKLTQQESSIWIEDAATGEIVGRVEGPTKRPLFLAY